MRVLGGLGELIDGLVVVGAEGVLVHVEVEPAGVVGRVGGESTSIQAYNIEHSTFNFHLLLHPVLLPPYETCFCCKLLRRFASTKMHSGPPHTSAHTQGTFMREKNGVLLSDAHMPR